ncbi:thiolase domain-containing protein [Desulfofundulus sp. TPOSR]|uniref:thiolase domain-containing protein n=1 Tax=Desulfofundulus sp. TPOSR TaxID=2714340 RepID=UPI00140AE6A4|nr:thiolase domain-containing protein [Desulfofundulus sp. TPOSR]NHM26384.1 thiolase domain-containing protein [Desulfofundulus sp. TPOSR]
MRRVAIIGAGQTPYGEFPTLGVKELFAWAFKDMLHSVDKGIDPREIQLAYIGSLSAGSGFQLGQLAALLMGHVGLPHVPAIRVENACASGGFALYSAICAVASGKCDIALAGGIEKMRDVSSTKTKYWLGISGDTEFERLAGLTFAGIYALVASRYMHEFGLTREQLAKVAVKNHKHGAMNPKAQFRREITLEMAVAGAPVAYPLNIWDCCPTTDGAAVVLLCSEERAREFTDHPVYIIGYGAGTDYLAVQDRDCITSFKAARMAAQEAYKQAGVKPEDIDFAEVHDCFTIAEVVAYYDLGFCEKGEAGRLLDEEATSLGGRIPVNVSGGLKSKGHPIGATGCGQAYEVFNQLRGQAKNPERQIKNAEIGLSHNVGGSGGTATVFIYRREG